jgi:hypothetical protein
MQWGWIPLTIEPGYLETEKNIPVIQDNLGLSDIDGKRFVMNTLCDLKKKFKNQLFTYDNINLKTMKKIAKKEKFKYL